MCIFFNRTLEHRQKKRLFVICCTTEQQKTYDTLIALVDQSSSVQKHNRFFKWLKHFLPCLYQSLKVGGDFSWYYITRTYNVSNVFKVLFVRCRYLSLIFPRQLPVLFALLRANTCCVSTGFPDSNL